MFQSNNGLNNAARGILKHLQYQNGQAYPFMMVSAGASPIACNSTLNTQQIRQYSQYPSDLYPKSQVPDYKEDKNPGPYGRKPVSEFPGLIYGRYALKAIRHARIPLASLAVTRRRLHNMLGSDAVIWTRVQAFKPICQRPRLCRKGGGVGTFDHWSADVQGGQILFEIDNVSADKAKAACWQAGHSLKVPSRFVSRRPFGMWYD